MRAEGARHRTPWFEVRSLESHEPQARIAIIVPRFGHTAVARNTVKRRLRELVRREVLPGLPAQPARDLVIRASPRAYRASFDELRTAVRAVPALSGSPARGTP